MSSNIQINCCTIFGQFIALGINIIYQYYLTKFYFEMDSSLNHLIDTKCLVIIMSYGFFSCFKSIIKTLIIIYNYKKQFSKLEYKNLFLPSNILIKKILKTFETLLEFTIVICCMIIMWDFTPISKNNCKLYSHELCVYFQIFTFFGWLYFVIISVMLLLFLTILYLGYKPQNSPVFITTINFTPFRFLDLGNNCNEECLICSENIKIIAITKCGHKMCKDCSETYIKKSINSGKTYQNILCPQCRQELFSEDTVDLHRNTGIV
jgi:hypothetical protein